VNKKRRVFVQLKGGLGNQMFQYATAKAFALAHNSELVVDDWSGFVRDFKYKRTYELKNYPIEARMVTRLERLSLFLYLFKFRWVKRKPNLVERLIFTKFINETDKCYINLSHELPLDSDIWLIGYWQSPLYFERFAATIRRELMPRKSVNPSFMALGERIRSSESVAVGIRIYEESKDPSEHARDGKIKETDALRRAVEQMKVQSPNATFYIFSTRRFDLINNLGLPESSVFVTHDDGYEGTSERLWLLTLCRHHIITNSSFYWWGAWLSAVNHAHVNQYILAADNFVNIDGVCKSWNRF
jgi:hypothetical protein